MGLVLSTDQKSNKAQMTLTCDRPGPPCFEMVGFDLNRQSVVQALTAAGALGWKESHERVAPGRKLWLCPRHSGKKAKRK